MVTYGIVVDICGISAIASADQQ